MTRLATLRMTSSSGWTGCDEELPRLLPAPGAEWSLLPEDAADGGGMGAIPAARMAAAMRRSAMTEAGVASMPLGLSRYDMV